MFGSAEVSVVAALVGLIALVVALQWSHRASVGRGELSPAVGFTRGPGVADRRRIAAELQFVVQADEELSAVRTGADSAATAVSHAPAPASTRRRAAVVSTAHSTAC